MRLHDAFNQTEGDPYEKTLIWRFGNALVTHVIYLWVIDPETCRRYGTTLIKDAFICYDDCTVYVDRIVGLLEYSIDHQTQSDYSNWETGSLQQLARRIAGECGVKGDSL